MAARETDADLGNRAPLEEPPCWDIEGLARQARSFDARILGRSVTAAIDYWLLGRVLERARGNFKKGNWYAWLKQHEIGQDRADRGRLLAAAFSSAEEFKGLTLEEALALATRRRPPVAQKLARKLRRRLDEIARSIERTADESEALANDRAGLFLAKAERLQQALDYFRRTCDPGVDQ